MKSCDFYYMTIQYNQPKKGGEAYEKTMDSEEGDDAAWERSN